MDERLIAGMREVEERHWWFQGRREVLIRLLGAHLQPGGKVLDVGCGTGFLLEAVAGTYEVAGLDPSPQAVAYCVGRGLSRVRPGGVEDLPTTPGGPFDAVTFFDVIEHLPDDVGALSLAREAIGPKGLVFVTVPAYQWLWSPQDTTHGHHRRYTRTRLEEAFRNAGLEPVRVGYMNSRLFPLAVPVRLMMKLSGRAHSAELDQPPGPLNGVMRRIFAGEAARIGRPGSSGYPFGLSVFGVARCP